MLQEMKTSQYADVLSYIRQDNARNYFIRLGLESSKPVFEKIIGQRNHRGELRAVLLKRLSGNLQFYADSDFDEEGLAECISHLDFDTLISARSYSDRLAEKAPIRLVKHGAIIAKLDKTRIIQPDHQQQYKIHNLRKEDLDQVVSIYEKIFTSFSSKAVMEKRLDSGRGRGVCIWEGGKIISVVQSEFEEPDSALIVGVGTDKQHQGKGLATRCLKIICSQLQAEGKDLYLQYDNMDAGRIYEKLGFVPIDQIGHYIKG